MTFNETTKNDKLWNRNFIIAMIVSASISMANGVFNPVLSIYAQSIGITVDIVGTVLSVSIFLSMFGRFLVGGLALRINKKRLVMFSLSLMLIAYLGFFFAKNLAVLTIAKILQAVGSGMHITTMSILVLDYIPQGRTGEGLGIYRLAGSLAHLLAPVIGTNLAKNSRFKILFILSVVFTFTSLIFLFIIEEKDTPKNRGVANNRKTRMNLKDYIYRPAFLPAVMLLFAGITYSAISSFMSIYGLSKGITNVGLFFTVQSLVMLVTSPMIGKIIDKKPSAYIVVTALALETVGCIFIALSSNLFYIIISAVIYGLGFGTSQSAIHFMALMCAPPEKRSVANSTYYVGGDLGLSIGSALAGILSHNIGFEYMFLAMAFVTFVSIIVFIMWVGIQSKGRRKPY
jgi:predicted MFS family arabinose efflux permease